MFSCVSDKPRVSIFNRSQITYDSIIVFSTLNSKVVFNNVKPKDVVKGKMIFDNKTATDGGYNIKLFVNNRMVKEKRFGYYTNGASLNRSFEIIIESETIRVNSK